jgi:hypothetical protein
MLMAIALLALARPALAVSWTSWIKPKGKVGNGDIWFGGAGPGRNIAVLFGGAFVTDRQVKAWADNLTDKAPTKLADFGVHVVYAVPGPVDARFAAREIQVDKLADAVNNTSERLWPGLIIFAAHSSGAAVAEQTLDEIARRYPKMLPTIVYFRLDGGGGIPAVTTKKLGGAFCVAAKCSKTLGSHNGGACYGGVTSKIVTDTPNGCSSDWCCHVALINTAPKTLNKGDANDYATFTGGSVANGIWLDKQKALLKRMAGP